MYHQIFKMFVFVCWKI